MMPILFDDCRFDDRDPYPGRQDDPKPGVHNSRWTPSPGYATADDPARWPQLQAYVSDLVGSLRQRPPRAGVGPVQRAGRRSPQGEPAAGGGGVPLGARRGPAAAADRGLVLLARLHDRDPAVRRTQLRRGVVPQLRQPAGDARAPRRAGAIRAPAAVHGVAGAPPRLQVRQPPAAVPGAQRRRLPVGPGRRAAPRPGCTGTPATARSRRASRACGCTT